MSPVRLQTLMLVVVLFGTAGCAGLDSRELAAHSVAVAENERQILVTFVDPGADRIDLAGPPGNVYRKSRRYGASPEMRRILAAVSEDYGLHPVDGWAMKTLGVYCELFTLAETELTAEFVATLSADPRVETVQAVQYFDIQGARDEDDPYRGMQFGLTAIQIEGAHRWARGEGVTVAVIDTGVAASHPDLRGRVRWSRDFVGGSDTSSVIDFHGTAVAGIIAAAAGNDLGIIGVAPESRLMALKACFG